VYFGFQTSGQTYKLYDPNGVFIRNITSNGNANTAAKAIAGPSQVVGAAGYLGIVYTPVAGSPAGNYYLECDGSSNETYWDIFYCSN